MNIRGNCWWKAEGTGLGQFIEINEKSSKAVIKVDATTHHQILKICEVRQLRAGWRVCSSQVAEDISNFMITVNLCLDPPCDEKFKPNMNQLYGLFVNFHWEAHDGERRIRVTGVEEACYSEWCRYEPILDPDEEINSDDNSDDSDDDNSDDSDDESDEEEAPILKFFREHCLPEQAKIPEEKGQKEAPQPVVRPRRRRI